MNDLSRWRRSRDEAALQAKILKRGPEALSAYKGSLKSQGPESDQVSYYSEMVKQGYASILKLLRQNINPVDLKTMIDNKISQIEGYIAAGGIVKPHYTSDLHSFMRELRNLTVGQSLDALDTHFAAASDAQGSALLASAPSDLDAAEAGLATSAPPSGYSAIDIMTAPYSHKKSTSTPYLSSNPIPPQTLLKNGAESSLFLPPPRAPVGGSRRRRRSRRR